MYSAFDNSSARLRNEAHRAPLVIDELLGEVLAAEEPDGPLPSAGIPVGDGRLPSVGNSLHADAHAARRAAAAEAARLNAASARINPATGAPARFRYRVAHHAAKQPQDAPHYHVIDEQGNQISGHFFYGRQPIRTQKKDRATVPDYDKRTRYPGADPATSYSQYRTEWHQARLGKAEGRQRRRMQKGYELEFESSAGLSVIDPRIDVHAQYAIQRMLKSPDPATRADGAGMLAAVKGGQLRGIFKQDQQVPALRARAFGLGWWQLIPAGQDSILFLDPEKPFIVFRDAVRSDAVRLDPALRKSWQAFRGAGGGPVQLCAPGMGGPIIAASSAAAYVLPAGYCTTAGNPTQSDIDFFCKKFEGNTQHLKGQHCFDAVRNAMLFLKGRAPVDNRAEGFLNADGASLCQGLKHTSGANCSSQGEWPMSNYSVVQYQPQALQKAVAQLKCALDKGYVVRAGVLSGRCADKPGQPCNSAASWRDCPEHYLLIIGYEDNQFVFWDWSGPSSVSPFGDWCASSLESCGLGFGILHYDPVGNRLTTARDDADLVVSGLAGCHALLRNGQKQKRYQVLSLYSSPYREPRRACGAANRQSAELTVLDELLSAETAAELMRALPLRSAGAPLPQELGGLVQEYEGLFERLRRWVGQNPVKAAVLKGAMDHANPLPAKMAALADTTQSVTEQRVEDANDRQRIQAQARNRPAAAGSPPPDRSRFAQPATNWADPRQALGQRRPLPRVKVTPGR